YDFGPKKVLHEIYIFYIWVKMTPKNLQMWKTLLHLSEMWIKCGKHETGKIPLRFSDPFPNTPAAIDVFFNSPAKKSPAAKIFFAAVGTKPKIPAKDLSLPKKNPAAALPRRRRV
ncbi:MAG: hypothetical protein ACOX8R_09785, partial [Bacillota bacterium]